MTNAILCNGCKAWETVDTLSKGLKIESFEHDYTTHLCENCANMFWKWMEKIPKVDEE